MKIEGRHSAVASDVDAAHDQLDLQDHLDELQLFGLRHYIFDHGARLRSRAELSQIQQRIGKPRSSSADSGDGSESMLRIRLLEQTVAEGGVDYLEFQPILSALALHRFSVVAQGILIDYLEWLKPGPETLSWVATKICQSLPPGEHSLGKLRAYFTAQGVRLLPNDRLDPKLFGHQVDRQRFKQELVELMKGGKNIDRRAVRLLTLHARDVKDMRDLFWMHRSLRSVLTKRTTIYQKDPDFGRLLALLVQKMGRRIDTFDLGQKILGLYRAGLAETPLSSVQSLIKTVAKDPRAVFFAERLFERLLIQEVHRLSKQPHTESRLENLQTLQESCWRSFDTLTKTRFDRWALRRMVLNLLGAERLSLSLAGGYLSAAATSKNAEDFMYAALVMFAQVPRMRTPDDLVVAWRRLLQILTSQAQGGQFNGNGSPIADPIHDAIQRRQAKRLVGRLSVGNWRVEDYAAVAWTRGGRGSL